MTNKNESEIISKINATNYQIKRMGELNRLRDLERTQITIIVMLIGFSVSLSIVKYGQKDIFSILPLASTIVLSGFLIVQLIPIYINNIQQRIESFGNNFLFIMIILVILIGTTFEAIIKAFIPELIVFFIVIGMSFFIGRSFSGFNDKIISRTYDQLPLLKKEIEMKRKPLNKKQKENEKIFNKIFLSMIIVGFAIPMIIQGILTIIVPKQAEIFHPYLIILLGFGIFGLLFILFIFEKTDKQS